MSQTRFSTRQPTLGAVPVTAARQPLLSLLRAAALMVLIAAGVSQAFATPEFPLDALAPGQRGHGLTAAADNVIERFPVEILGLQHDVGLGFPLVLIRAEGEFIERSGGIAAGMSGSPIYLEHEGEEALLGAIGFVFPNSEVGLGLVTPIEIMRRTEPTLPEAELDGFGEEHFADLGEAIPVKTPLLLSGISGRASEHLAPLFKDARLELMPVQGGGVSSAQDEAYTLEPGSAISVQLVRGDITVAAVGTATLIENGAMWAFGHPLLNQGEVSFGVAPAHVSYIVPSDVVPFKLANSGQRLLGSITEDRPYAISGLVDQEPEFLPVSVSFNSRAGNIRKRFEVTADERYYSALLATATLQIFDDAIEKIGPGTADLAWEITFENGEVLRLLEQISSAGDIAAQTAALAAEPLFILADNIFADPEIARISLSIDYQEEQRYAEIVNVAAENETLQPGERLTAYVRMQPYRNEPEVKTVRVDIPEEVSGPLSVTFRGGLERNGNGGGNGNGEILSFNELLVALRDHVQANELIVEAFVDGELTQLKRESFPYLIRGSDVLNIEIDNDEVDDDPASEDAPDPDMIDPDDPNGDDPPSDEFPDQPPRPENEPRSQGARR